ncbi:MAG: HlyD family secretion protein [Clostridiales bacterium]|jgi:multidrug efflux pump subunit AcrA (membrane-fusion protein)|nr:HlyD family secretion protein [Clostridiales bacterium]
MAKAARGVGMISLLIFAALVFFSRTIYDFNTPLVTTVLPSNGKLTKTETSTGVISWAKKRGVYASLNGTVEEVLVEDDDWVDEGQYMAKLRFDTEDVSNRLSELALEKRRIEASASTLATKRARTESLITDLGAEIYETDSVSEYSLAQAKAKLEKSENAIKKAEEALADATLLEEAGGISKSELKSFEEAVLAASYEASALALEIEAQEEQLLKQRENNAKAVTEKEKVREDKLKEYRYQLVTISEELTSSKLELERIALEKKVLDKKLQEYSDSIYICAPVSGVVTSIAIEPGQQAGSLSIATIAVQGEVTLECEISLYNDFVSKGDECRLENTSNALAGTVLSLTPENGVKKAVISVPTDASEGETYEVTFSKESPKSYTLVPNGALGEDSDGYFVYMIDEREGMLGKERYAKKHMVYAGDSDSQNTIILSGLTFFEPLVLLSDKPFSDGERVRLKNEGDLIVD